MQKIIYDKGLYSFPNHYGYVEDTEIYFTNEKIYLTVECSGKTVFADGDGNKIAEIFVDPKTDNSKHSSAFCKAENGKICVYFSIITYKDNYPNCDGEYDRWSEVCIGYNCIEFDTADRTLKKCETKSIV